MNFLDLIDNAGPDWHRRAVCHPDNGYSPDIWFPLVEGGNGNPARHRSVLVRRAQEFCFQCPVRAQCLADAIETKQTSGIWGGMDFEGKKKKDSAA